MAELKYVDWDGLVYYDGKIKAYIEDKSEDYLKMGGITTFDKLPDPSFQNLNYIYKITDEFVSNSDFDKPGYQYKAGTWVQVTDIDNTAVYRYTIFNEETLGGTADLSNYYTKSEVEEIVQEAIDSIDIPEVDSFVTSEQLQEVLLDYVVESELEQYKEDVAEVATSLEEKADKTELVGLATEDYIDNKLEKITQSIETIENNYVSNTYITQNYTTTEELAATYVTQETVTEVVTNEVNTVVTEQIETKVTEVIQEKVDSGEIDVTAELIKYDTWD